MREIFIKLVLTWSLLFGSTHYALANICFELPSVSSPKFEFDDSITVTSLDNVSIAANLFTPTSPPPSDGYPAIIFVNSWVLDEHEYILQAAQFAKKGYLVFSYSARGWGCSGGQVNVVGDKDMQDLSAVVDWLQANTAVDSNNIGISGISYGSGISLMGLAKEPRIKTAVAMSTWGSLTDSLYQHQTPRSFWGFFLVASGFVTANMDPIIAQNYQNLLINQNITETLNWAEERSVVNFVDLINERNAPVYLANNFGDNLFQPNNLLKFYQQLTGPKRIDLNQGTHASGEGFGLVGLESYTWDNTHRWFDYWLKNIDTGIMQQQPVTMLVDLKNKRDEYSDYPLPGQSNETFYLGARGVFSNGDLRDSPYRPWWGKTNTIYSGLDTLATTGIPVLSAILDAHIKTPVKTPMGLISRTNGIVFDTPKLSQTMKIRGIPKVKLNLRPSFSKMQIVGYLYDIAPNGVGTLITHGPVTTYNANPGKTQSIEWELVATAYDVPAGHKLGIAFDTFDLLYGIPTILPYNVKFKFSKGLDSTLTIPTVD
ncbi:prolyl oligopeptidase family serine peptidase [Aliikangiella marina]|uniref:Prolyl oligopeptidase family serine peptidase n=1 Tax=Aliikangiella marina TaxID=1712262 RepID=A0A545TC04_9GAMM|nr:alpha/beta fold hydrolase [Aliikangiella marina]TQV74740.1 prolyl oligopeptidase family serine peptidase [Aliikangiella marina]